MTCNLDGHAQPVFEALARDPDVLREVGLSGGDFMDSLQTLFHAAVAEMFQALADEMPHSEALLRLVAQPDAPGDPTDLFDGWHARRLRTMRFFERQKQLAVAIREAGGTPRLHA